MALKKKPVTGMKDIMPAEMEIRDYVIGLIKDTYRTFGFSSMETPCVEHIENLCSKQGGDNEKLIFKILKRGEKLKLDEAEEESDLVDGGLRYDLTVPLSRYYANHANELPSPFKALQMGNVWRADRPQRGRYRQFMQCDIDILGEPSNLAEIEMGSRVAKSLVSREFMDWIELSNDYSMVEIAVPAKWAGQSLAEVNARERLGINVVGIIVNGKIDVTPDPQKPLPEGGILIVIGSNDILERFDSKRKL